MNASKMTNDSKHLFSFETKDFIPKQVNTIKQMNKKTKKQKNKKQNLRRQLLDKKDSFRQIPDIQKKISFTSETTCKSESISCFRTHYIQKRYLLQLHKHSKINKQTNKNTLVTILKQTLQKNKLQEILIQKQNFHNPNNSHKNGLLHKISHFVRFY